MMQPECPADRKKRGVFSIGQQYPRPLHPARRFSARLRYRSQLRRISFSKRQLNRPPPRCHDFSSRSLVGTRDICGNPKTKIECALMTTDNFHGIDRLARKITVAAIEVQSRAAGTHTPPRCDLSYFLRKLSRAFLADLELAVSWL